MQIILKVKYIITIILLLILLSACSPSKPTETNLPELGAIPDYLASSKTEAPAAEKPEEKALKQEEAAVPDEPVKETTKEFSAPGYELNFRYPSSYGLTAYSGGDGERILVLSPASVGKEARILISPQDKDTKEITTDMIRQDLPELPLQEAKDSIVDGVKTLIFNSADSELGETQEAWFIYNGFLYQVITPAGTSLLDTILADWKFK